MKAADAWKCRFDKCCNDVRPSALKLFSLAGRRQLSSCSRLRSSERRPAVRWFRRVSRVPLQRERGCVSVCVTELVMFLHDTLLSVLIIQGFAHTQRNTAGNWKYTHTPFKLGTEPTVARQQGAVEGVCVWVFSLDFRCVSTCTERSSGHRSQATRLCWQKHECMFQGSTCVCVCARAQ